MSNDDLTLTLHCDACNRTEHADIVPPSESTHERIVDVQRAVGEVGWHYWVDENLTMCDKCQGQR